MSDDGLVKRLRAWWSGREGFTFEAAFATVTLALASPLLASRHVPLQDLPQHMAATAVLRRLIFSGELDALYTLSLSRTQYLDVYALAVPLSAVVGVENALKLVAAGVVVAIPYALRAVLRRTGRDPRLAALSWPILWNPQMLLGFLNFLLGVPLALSALALLAQRDVRRTRRAQGILAVLALGTFYAHLIPYGMLGLGALLLLDVDALRDEGRPLAERVRSFARDALRDLGFLIPSLVATAVWMLRTPANDASVRAGGVGVSAHPEWPAFASLPRELSGVLLDLPGERDERALLLWGAAVLAALAAGVGASSTARAPRASRGPVVAAVACAAVYLLRHRTFAWVWGLDTPAEATWGEIGVHAACVAALGALVAGAAPAREEPAWAPAPARLAWLPLLCGALYGVAPASYGWIWPIHTRFAVAAALIVPLTVGARAGGLAVRAVVLLSAVAALGLTDDLGRRFARWEQNELGDLDDALAHARPRAKLLALLRPQQSAEVPNVPTLHAAAYYQVRGGDVATFSFADFPQSPFRFRDDGPRPPRLRPRWEWEADLDAADPAHRYYDYVLCRRGHEQPARDPDRYARIFDGRDWVLFQRR
ncbi:MAG: hypothetical protein U0325_08675 [Polyangiales bacterium]